ncbi:MAG: M48 family metalloprotease, partial [Synergistes sp.]|nr:M48 family metalloprotease [Synergistes sp.]
AGVGANIGANLAYSGWSREQEIEADDFAVLLAVQDGEDPVGMYKAISRLAKVNKTEPSGFNSHPPDDRRLLHIKNKILELKPDAKFPD